MTGALGRDAIRATLHAIIKLAFGIFSASEMRSWAIIPIVLRMSFAGHFTSTLQPSAIRRSSVTPQRSIAAITSSSTPVMI
jgi:hypothetical protein